MLDRDRSATYGGRYRGGSALPVRYQIALALLGGNGGCRAVGVGVACVRARVVGATSEGGDGRSPPARRRWAGGAGKRRSPGVPGAPPRHRSGHHALVVATLSDQGTR